MIQEKIIIGQGTEFPLNGILTLPDSAEKDIPAVVLVHGSGPQNMDEKVGVITPFLDMAEALPDKGIAVLRYDKRTKIYGKKMMQHPGDITVKEETIEDAVMATKLLRGDPRIGKVFMLGHSMGGMLAPRIDAEGGDFDGIIIAAGSLRTLRGILLDQLVDVEKRYKGLIKKLVNKQIKKITTSFAAIDSMSDVEAKEKNVLGKTRAYYFKEMEAHPASQYLENMSKPVFIFQGDADFQVNPDKDFAGYKQLLEGKPNVTFRLYQDLNHVFTNSHATRSAKDYKVPGKVDSRITNDIAEWILAG